MRAKIKILSLLLVFSLICLLPPSVCAAPAENGLIRQILLYYSQHRENAETDIADLLAQLEALNPETAEDWRQILSMWCWAAEDLELNWDTLPDGLPQDESLCIVVMGFQLEYGGGMSQELLRRLEVALASAQKYPNAYILCTGGGTAPGNGAVTEAGQMAAWLEEAGIAPERIILENKSWSTELNALYGLKILSTQYPEIRSLALVSSHYHLRRCYLLFTAAIQINNPDLDYSVVGNACFDAGYEGTEEGYWEEAKSLGNMLGIALGSPTPPPLCALTGITVQGDTEYAFGDPLNLKVIAEYDSGFSREVTSGCEIPDFDPETPGTREITIRYTENGVTIEQQLTITIAPPPTTIPPATLPPEAEAPRETAAPTEPQSPRKDSFSPLPLLGIGGFILIRGLLRLVFRPYRGKYEKRRK